MYWLEWFRRSWSWGAAVRRAQVECLELPRALLDVERNAHEASRLGHRALLHAAGQLHFDRAVGKLRIDDHEFVLGAGHRPEHLQGRMPLEGRHAAFGVVELECVEVVERNLGGARRRNEETHERINGQTMHLTNPTGTGAGA